VCDRIVIIDHGRDIATGTLPELVAQTIGPARRVTLRLDRPPDTTRLDGNGFTIEGNRLSCKANDVAAELPPLLTRVHAAGLRVEDVSIEAPSLHAVFLHLTGKELRE
jgi:ABC-2 type transport system ATP-binding protein